MRVLAILLLRAVRAHGREARLVLRNPPGAFYFIMARTRYLKPDFFKDEDLALLPLEARLFFAGLWNFADKAGRLEDRPKRLKVEIFPYDDINIEKCLALLSQPKNGSGKPFIQRYTVNSEKYIQISQWDKHQKPHHTEAESKIPPAPPLHTTITIMESVVQGTTELSNGAITVKNLCDSIINDLNQVLHSNYKLTTKITQDLIRARIREGFTFKDFQAVHRNMLRHWGADNKMREFLRPITLYSNKFESYLNIKQEAISSPKNEIKDETTEKIKQWKEEERLPLEKVTALIAKISQKMGKR